MPLTTLQQKELHEVLERLQLGTRDRAVYLALLASEQTTITPLSRALRLPVTTVQSICNRLALRGLLNVTKRGSRSVYEAHDPMVFQRLLERQREEVAGIIPFLKELRASTPRTAAIRVYERDRVSDILSASLACSEKLVHELVAAGPFQQVIGERLHYTRRRIAAGVRLKSLRVETQEIKRYSAATHVRELREARFLPRDITFAWSIFFWDHTVAFFSPKDEGIAWTIESQTFRTTVQQLFDLLWSVSRKMETA